MRENHPDRCFLRSALVRWEYSVDPLTEFTKVYAVKQSSVRGVRPRNRRYLRPLDQPGWDPRTQRPPLTSRRSFGDGILMSLITGPNCTAHLLRACRSYGDGILMPPITWTNRTGESSTSPVSTGKWSVSGSPADWKSSAVGLALADESSPSNRLVAGTVSEHAILSATQLGGGSLKKGLTLSTWTASGGARADRWITTSTRPRTASTKNDPK